MAIILALVIGPELINSFFASMVMVQNKNAIVSPLQRADIVLTILATTAVLPNAKREKKRPII
jgi:hypothetical protein